MPKEGFLTKGQREAINRGEEPENLPRSDEIRRHVQVLTSDLKRVEKHYRNSEEPEDPLEFRILTALLEWEISKLDAFYNHLKDDFEKFLNDLEKVESALIEDLDLLEPDVDKFTLTGFPQWKAVLDNEWRAVNKKLLENIEGGEEPPSWVKELWEEHGFNVDEETGRWRTAIQRFKQSLEPVSRERVYEQVKEASERRRVLTRLLLSVVEDHEEGRSTEDGKDLPIYEILRRVAENDGDLGLKLEGNSKRRAKMVLGECGGNSFPRCPESCGHLELVEPGYESRRTTYFNATERGQAINEALNILREEAFSGVYKAPSIPWEKQAAKLHKLFSSWRSWTRPEKK